VLAAAKPGDTIRLGPGTYEGLSLVGRQFSPAITIEAAGARVVAMKLKAVDGVTIRGGTFQLGPPIKHPRSGEPFYGAAIRMDKVSNIRVLDGRFLGPSAVEDGERLEFGDGFGVRTIGGSKIEVLNGRFAGFKTGVAMTRIEGFRIAGNTFSGMRGDGASVSLSHHGVFENNSCDSTRVRDGEHPDCIQMWSRPTAPPVSDIMIRRNRIEGSTQGIGFHNHVRNGVDDGGFDRIVIEDNVIDVSRANAIRLSNARDSVVRNNKVTTQPGARFRASINVVGGSSVKVCGNTVGAGAGKPGVKDDPC
jgi:hypothetical protein